MITDQEERPLIDEKTEAQLFWRIRRQTTSARLRQLMQTARLRTLLVVALSLFFWFGLFVLFYFSFGFLVNLVGQSNAQFYEQTVAFVFHLFFASLNVMLIFSSGIILYGGLFSSEETRFFLTLPIRSERIVLHKFYEALLFSSWGFFLLASPLTMAYGLAVAAPWHYYVLAPPLILAFAYIPSGIGALCCLFIVYRLAHLRVAIVAIAAALAIAAAASAVWSATNLPQDQIFGEAWFQETQRKFSLSQKQWLPSTWLSRALLDAAKPLPPIPLPLSQTPVSGALANLALLTANALMCRVLIVSWASRWLRPAFSQLECRPRRPRRAALAWMDLVAEFFIRPFPMQIRLLMIKDWRLLRRDPVQWSQFLIFFGLLSLYFLNVNRFSGAGNDLSHTTWVNMVSFLNLAVVGLILSTFTTRFIYPMISLEGRRFWVLGLMPIRRETIVWSKFVFASLGSWAPCAGLVLLSDLMLRVSFLVIAVHQLTTVLLCFGLAALAVGLGASMPDFRESSPSKIAAGFGGTLNLVLSACYILVIVVLTALPCHFYLISKGGSLHRPAFDIVYLEWWLVGGVVLALVFGVITTVVSLWRGIRAFKRLDFY